MLKNARSNVVTLLVSPFFYTAKISRFEFAKRFFILVTLLVSILARLMSCGFVASTLSSRQCTRILICLLSSTNCPLSFCFSSKSLPALFYKNFWALRAFVAHLAPHFLAQHCRFVRYFALCFCRILSFFLSNLNFLSFFNILVIARNATMFRDNLVNSMDFVSCYTLARNDKEFEV